MLLTARLLICLWLVVAFLAPTTLGSEKSSTGNGKDLKSVHESIITELQSRGIKADRAVKEKYLDEGDYYFLNTGEKASFLRKQNTYFIVYKKKATPLLSPDELQSRFGDELDVVKDHSLKKLTKIKIKKYKEHKDVLSGLYQADSMIDYISPALTSKDKGGEIAIVPSIIVSVGEDADTDHVLADLLSYNLSFVSKLSFTDNEFELIINEFQIETEKIFEITRMVAELPYINWAEPNFIVSATPLFTPSDPLYSNQWHLHNTGQLGGAVDADIDAPEGWNISQGDGTVIAVIDDGIDLSHEDLAIWSNPGETGSGKETNGIDDDGNDYIDDYRGWDFEDNDNNPNPVDANENHGTAVAGVAGAIGHNGIGVTGSSQGSLILPIRWPNLSCASWGNAMRYAGKYADVVNNSWSISGCESELNSAISDVVNGSIAGARRGTKGTPVIFASGNSASGWRVYSYTGFIPGNVYTFQWRFSKDYSISEGYDTVWLDNITWPGGGTTSFESDTVGTIPTGFTSYGHAFWTVVSDGVHARGASGKSVKAGPITHSHYTVLETSIIAGSGDLTFWVWVSSEMDYDFFDFYINGSRYLHTSPGQYGHFNDVGYPASNPDTIAVGASNDGAWSGLEERSYYSQFGSELDVVAPSSAGEIPREGQGITTTDRMGGLGYDPSNYTASFSGTSSSAPLVAGVVANMIALNPNLTAAQIRTKLRAGTDKIGPYAYVGGRNDYYGYGRVNMYKVLQSICVPTGFPDTNCDGVDDDCDGTPDDNYIVNASCGTGMCQTNNIPSSCVNGSETLCQPGSPTGDDSDCDGYDDNCNGTNDENYVVDDMCGVGVCQTNNTPSSCVSGSETLCQPGSPTETPEVTCDGEDNDCDGAVDEGFSVRILDTPPDYYNTIQGASDVATDGDIIQTLGVTITENIHFSQTGGISLRGGYVCDYSDNPGYTTIDGQLIFDGARVVLDKIIIK